MNTAVPKISPCSEPPASELSRARLLEFFHRHPRLLVLTGAGISTASGIPDYRDRDGNWKHKRPVQFPQFVASAAVRQRYWLRAMVGWPRIRDAKPNATHHALTRLERGGRIHQLVTQNVDGLHQKAGSRRVIDIHGRLDTVTCLGCGKRERREIFQATLVAANPGFKDIEANIAAAPDGDAQLDTADFKGFQVPDCRHCGGILKPNVVFFGEGIPRPRVEHTLHRLSEADALLVVGSSLMVFSGYRYVLEARNQGKPIAVVNLGSTRADDLIDLKLTEACDQLLPTLADIFAP